MPLNMKNINNFTQWKNGSVDVTYMHAITHQKLLAQSWHSMCSAVDIFSTLRVFTKEPIRGQEIKLRVYECNPMYPCLFSTNFNVAVRMVDTVVM